MVTRTELVVFSAGAAAGVEEAAGFTDADGLVGKERYVRMCDTRA